jgi:2-polyprenyl-6-methoxyphenol hydroxylase-like FAD-dependent oxidoreductase
MFSFDAEEMKDSSSVSRWLLRNALLHKCSRFVKFGKTFQRYQKLPNGGVKVCFDDGSAEEYDLLVGADGVGSRVRNQLIPSSKVSDSDVAVIYFKIPLTPDTKDLLPASSAVMVYSQLSAFQHCRRKVS